MKENVQGTYEAVSEVPASRRATKSGLTSKLGNFVRGMAVAGMLYAGALAPKNTDADLIRVINNSGSENVGSSTMFLRHQEGGELGGDTGDGYWGSERPPGMSANDNWLRIYSDQVNQYYDLTEWEMDLDNRPFHLERGEEEFNQPFPLILDTRYKTNQPPPHAITSSNNFVRFELQAGPDVDQERQYYHWTMTLDSNVAVFAEGGYEKSGTIDWVALGGQGSTTDLPAYHINDAQGIYGWLEVVPMSAGAVTTVVTGEGAIAPNNPTNLPPGWATNFVVEAFSEDIHISSVVVDGVTIYTNALNRGMVSTNVAYTVMGDGSIEATFTPSATISGIPLSWLTQYGITNKADAVETEDLDEDGHTVLEEWIADTDPTDAESVPPRLEGYLNGTNLYLRIAPTSTARMYTIEFTPSLTPPDWSDFTDSMGVGTNLVFPVTVSTNAAFFRHRIELP